MIIGTRFSFTICPVVKQREVGTFTMWLITYCITNYTRSIIESQFLIIPPPPDLIRKMNFIYRCKRNRLNGWVGLIGHRRSMNEMDKYYEMGEVMEQY